MLNKIKVTLVSTATMILFAASCAGASIASAPNVAAQPLIASAQGQACNGLSQLGGTTCGPGATSSISRLMRVTLNLLSLAAGFIAVVMVIISGIKFMTANGDASAISSARQSLIYALVGLIVAAISQILVQFVFHKVT